MAKYRSLLCNTSSSSSLSILKIQGQKNLKVTASRSFHHYYANYGLEDEFKFCEVVFIGLPLYVSVNELWGCNFVNNHKLRCTVVSMKEKAK